MSHKRRAALAVVKRVKGAPSFSQAPKFIGCPSFFTMPIATTLALAPYGVRFPPRQEPSKSANIYNSPSVPAARAKSYATGSITIM